MDRMRRPPATAGELLAQFVIATFVLGMLLWLTKGIPDGTPWWQCFMFSAAFSAASVLIRAVWERQKA